MQGQHEILYKHMVSEILLHLYYILYQLLQKLSKMNENKENQATESEKYVTVKVSESECICQPNHNSVNIEDKDSELANPTSSKIIIKVLLIILKVLLFFTFLYFFICALDIMSTAFRLLGGKGVGLILQNHSLLKNPIAGLVIGIMITVLVQSSSTSTAIIVTMVGADFIAVEESIYMVMGANIGTSITNTLVSLGQVADKQEFSRAFSGATVHDLFNFLTVFCLLPIEAASGALAKLTGLIVESSKQNERYSALKFDLLKKLTKPLTHLIVVLDKKVVNDPKKLLTADTMLLNCCGKINNETCTEPCHYSFVNTSLTDAAIGGILLVASLLVLVACLIGLVKVLKSLISGQIQVAINKVLQPHKCNTLVDYLSIIVGMLLTIAVQSSSVLTSTLTPLVGTGVIPLEKMYPLCLGANVGTTITGILAALATAKSTSLQTAITHLLFNIIGILIWFPIPFMRKVPITLATKLGESVAQYRWIAGVYIILVFFFIPLILFGLSVINTILTIVVASVCVAFLIMIAVINVMQNKYPKYLPNILKTWDILPKPLRSAEPYDRVFTMCCKCKSHNNENNSDVKIDLEDCITRL